METSRNGAQGCPRVPKLLILAIWIYPIGCLGV